MYGGERKVSEATKRTQRSSIEGSAFDIRKIWLES
jgi:hypothetical protein